MLEDSLSFSDEGNEVDRQSQPRMIGKILTGLQVSSAISQSMTDFSHNGIFIMFAVTKIREIVVKMNDWFFIQTAELPHNVRLWITATLHRLMELTNIALRTVIKVSIALSALVGCRSRKLVE